MNPWQILIALVIVLAVLKIIHRRLYERRLTWLVRKAASLEKTKDGIPFIQLGAVAPWLRFGYPEDTYGYTSAGSRAYRDKVVPLYRWDDYKVEHVWLRDTSTPD